MAKSKLKEEDVLCFSNKRRNNATVRRFYSAWRKRNNARDGCDNKKCTLFNSKPLWNGQLLVLILDHVDGCNKNNFPNNLQLLCPNCSIQQPTHGGKNKGRIKEGGIGYSIKHSNGSVDVKLFPQPILLRSM